MFLRFSLKLLDNLIGNNKLLNLQQVIKLKQEIKIFGVEN